MTTTSVTTSQSTPTTITSGNTVDVLNGGVIVDWTINSGGTADVFQGGLDSGTVLAGFEILSGGTASGTTVSSGAAQYVSSGGIAIGTTLTSDGYAAVFFGGTFDGGTVASGATMALSNGRASDNTVAGTQTIRSLGTAYGTTLLGGGAEFVYSGTAIGTTISAGAHAEIYLGGTLIGGTIDGGGYAAIYGGADSSTVVSSGADLDVTIEGRVVGAVVSSGGAIIISSGGDASGVTVSDGGTLLLLPDAFAQGTTGNVISAGAAIISSGQYLISANSAAISGAVIGANEVEYVFSGGSTTGTKITSGGFEQVSYGATTTGTVISTGGTEVTSSGTAVIGTVVRNGGYLTVNGGTASLTLVSGGGIEGVVNGGIVSGTVLKSGGVEEVNNAGIASAITISNGGTAEVFTGGTITGELVQSGGAVALEYLTYAAGGTAQLVEGTTNEVTVSVGAQTATLLLSGDYTGVRFQVTQGRYGGSLVTDKGTAPCYCRGTLLLTVDGNVAVEDLRIGDSLLTWSGALRPIRWIGHRSYDGRFIAGNRDILPVKFAAGALAEGIPARDLCVSPKHGMFLDGSLIPAELLLNGGSIVQLEQVEELTYFHIELDTHDVLIAEGAPSESFVDCNSRGMFHNAQEFAARYPDDRSPQWAFCAPRVEDGHALDVVQQRLAARAGLVAHHVEDAAEPGQMEGHVDAAYGGGISGWAFDPGRPHTPVHLEVLADGVVIDEIVANMFRADLVRAGKAAGRCAFTHRLSVRLSPDLAHVLTVRRVADHTELAGAPMRVPPATEIGVLEGCVDRCTATFIEGWAFDAMRWDVPVLLDILDDGHIIGRIRADRYRFDLEQAGKGRGACGFLFRFDEPLAPQRSHAIEVRRTVDQALLDGGPLVLEAARHDDVVTLVTEPARSDALDYRGLRSIVR